MPTRALAPLLSLTFWDGPIQIYPGSAYTCPPRKINLFSSLPPTLPLTPGALRYCCRLPCLSLPNNSPDFWTQWPYNSPKFLFREARLIPSGVMVFSSHHPTRSPHPCLSGQGSFPVLEFGPCLPRSRRSGPHPCLATAPSVSAISGTQLRSLPLDTRLPPAVPTAIAAIFSLAPSTPGFLDVSNQSQS